MSHILNALRKSEQERQALKPETITHRITHNSPSRPKTRASLLLLVICNILLILYFVFQHFYGHRTPEPQKETPTGNDRPKTEHFSPKTSITPSSIENVVETSIPPKVKTQDKPAPESNQEATKPLAHIQHPQEKEPSLQAVPLNSQQLPPKESVAIETRSPGKESDKNVVAPIEKTNTILPLPEEARRELPHIVINVLAFNPDPAKRFVIIDMTKYTVGQRIKDALNLLEIREDGLIVEYRGQQYKVR